MLVGVTGHRPERLGTNWPIVERWIAGKLEEYKARGEKVSLISGMARGVDQIAATTAIDQGVGVRCYYPYMHKFSNLEDYIMTRAEVIRYEHKDYVPQCYTDRDRRIVDDCDVLLVVWDGIKYGGTYYTYKYALEKGKKVEVFKIPVAGSDLNGRKI